MSSSSSSSVPISITKWFEDQPLFGRIFSNCVSTQLVSEMVQGWVKTLSASNATFRVSTLPSAPVYPTLSAKGEKMVYLTTSTELEGRLACSRFKDKKIDLPLYRTWESTGSEGSRVPHGFRLWPSHLRMDPQDKSQLIHPDMMVSKSRRFQQWMAKHWIDPQVCFYNPLTQTSSPIQISVWDIKRWSFHGMLADSHRLECAREISSKIIHTFKPSASQSQAKYKSASAKSMEEDGGVWTITQKRAGLHFEPLRQIVVADVPELQGFALNAKEKERRSLPCNFCIDLTEEHNSTPRKPDEINEICDRWIKSQTHKEKQWGMGQMRLSTTSESKSLSNRTVGTSKSKRADASPSPLPPSTTPTLRRSATLPCMDEASPHPSIPVPTTPTPLSSGTSMKSPIVFQNYIPPSVGIVPSLGGVKGGVSPPPIQEERKISTTNIRLRHMEPLIRYKLGCWLIEIRCVYHFWDVTPLLVQKENMKYAHQREKLWDKHGILQQLEIEVELDIKDAHSRADAQGKIGFTVPMLEYLCTQLLVQLAWANLLLREMNREDREPGYKSPYLVSATP